MIPAGARWGYVLTAYGITALVIAGLIAWVVISGIRHKRTLADLEARGVRRRSSRDSAA